MKVSAVILAGGRGQRMGGQDKGSVIFKGAPLVTHVINRIAPQIDELVISANRNIDFYKQFNYPVLADDMGEYWGPLAGIATAMKFCQCDVLLTVPCDTPDLPADLFKRMLTVMQEKNKDVVMAEDRQRQHPVISLVKCSLYSNLLDYLQQGERKVMKWMQLQDWATADFSDETDCFININSENDLA